MNILQALKQLRDDLKTWVTANINALNSKIDLNTVYVDNKLDSTSTNPVQNKVVTNAINNIPRFSGDYNDLTNAPNISEDDSGNIVIADETGNIIFKADAEGVHTTAISINGDSAATETYVDNAVASIEIPDVDFTGYATETYVDNAITEIPTPDVSGQINSHNTNENAHEDIRQAIVEAKEELSESIVSESDEWKIVDEAGNIIFSVDASGVHTTKLTLDGENAATEEYVNEAIANIDFSTNDLNGYATETYVDNALSDLVNSAPEALNTLGELATAMKNHEDAYDALLEVVGNKASFDDLESAKEELSENIVADSKEFHIVDNNGNIISTIDANGIETTTITVQTLNVNGLDIEELIVTKSQEYVNSAILEGSW